MRQSAKSAAPPGSGDRPHFEVVHPRRIRHPLLEGLERLDAFVAG